MRRRAGPDAEPADRKPPDPEQQRERLLAYAFRALGQRALSEAELKTRLERRSEEPQLVAAVLLRVKELGYLNDREVARQESARRGVGSFRVGQKLRQRGLERTLIEETVAARDPDAELDDARSVLTRRWPGFQRAADPGARAYAFLARRGYPSNLIRAVLKELGQGETEGECGE